MKIDRKLLGEALRFCITGIVATALHYAIYLLLKQWMPHVVAFAVGYFLSFVANFFMTARFTFRQNATARRGAGFLAAHAVNFLVQTVLLQTFLWLGVDDRLAPVPVYCIAVPLNFLLVRLVFRK